MSQTHRHHRWADIPAEAMKGKITRRIISGDQVMSAEIFLAEGDEVPRHSHPNEQVSHILKGALAFSMGEEGVAEEVVVRAGEVLVIPANLPHAAVALEDTLAIDIFAPPREDWLNGTDAYLRG